MRTRKLELALVLLAIVAVAVWQRPESSPFPEPSFDKPLNESKQVDLHPSMNGLELRSAPGEVEQWKIMAGGQPFARVEYGGLTVELDHGNTRILALKGGTLRTDQGEIDSTATLEVCIAVMGEPARTEPGAQTWDVGPGERVYRYESDGESVLHLVAVEEL